MTPPPSRQSREPGRGGSLSATVEDALERAAPRPAKPAEPAATCAAPDRRHPPRRRAATRAQVRRMSIVSVVGVSLIALVMNTWRLGLNGLGNQYYTAAAPGDGRQLGQLVLRRPSIPAGFISVDKPPVPLWVTGLSARLFGVNTWSILLPSALAGAGGRRRAVGGGPPPVRARRGDDRRAGAGAVTGERRRQPAQPARAVAGAVPPRRGVGAAALVRLGHGPIWWVVLAGSFVGLAFNTKMLAAYLVVPAMGVAILIGSSTWPRRIVHSLAFGVVSLATSLPWILIVDAVPASSRPWVGGSAEQHRDRPDLRVQRPRPGGGQRRLHPRRPDQPARRGVRRPARPVAVAVRRARRPDRLARSRW